MGHYVGARYVPKFANPLEWAENTAYEAMTVVSYNNNSYTSKIPVPPTVGNPADNPKYWALTGNYNAQVEQYRQETETVSNSLTTLQGQITTEITNRETADATLQGNISSEAATRASADSNLQSQINQIVAPSGEAPSAAEVQNARIGADRVTYDTLGNAIRGQVTDLKSALDQTDSNILILKNLVTEIIAGKYVTTKSGKIVIADDESRGYVRIKVKGGHTYATNTDWSPNFSFWAHQVSEGVEQSDGQISTIPSDNIITAPATATILYLSYGGWTASTDLVVVESNLVFKRNTKTNYPFNTVKQITIPRLKTDDDLKSLCNYVGAYSTANFERGDLRIDPGTTVPKNDKNSDYYAQRVRTPIFSPFALTAGDKISINGNSAITYYVLYPDSTKLIESRWLQDDFIAPATTNYWIVIRRTDNASATLDELTSSLSITRPKGITKQIADLSERVDALPKGITKQIADLSDRVDALEEDESAKIPDYYFKNNYLPGKIEDIKADLGFVNGAGFIFFTDPHFNANEKNSKYLIKEIIDKTTLDLVICGGDIVGLIGTEAELYAEAETLVDYQNFIGKDIFFSTRGNHDFYNRDDNNSQNRWLTEGEAYNILGRNSERYTVDMIPEHLCYVIENAAQKTCYLMMNSKDASGATQSYISGAQAKWIADTLTKYSTWNIVAISHIPSDSNMDSYDPTQAIIQTLLEAFNNKTSVSTTHKGTQITADYREATGHVICHIVGHSHKDGSTLTNGVLSILTTCDARYRDDGYGATAGTITEQAFDVFCIDYDAKTITAIRVGRGSNRKWSFDGDVIT